MKFSRRNRTQKIQQLSSRKTLTHVYREPIIPNFRRGPASQRRKRVGEVPARRSAADGGQTLEWTIDHPRADYARCGLRNRETCNVVAARAKSIRAPDDFLSPLSPFLSATAASREESGPEYESENQSRRARESRKAFSSARRSSNRRSFLKKKNIISYQLYYRMLIS